jgi:DNA-binding transcriptional regulator YbjK
MRRKPNLEQRRRELCDAAIQLLAADGVKGVSHLKVDRKAGVPGGTTSFYFRTRSALLHAVAARVAELDLKELAAATKPSPASNGSGTQPGPSGLAVLVIRSATGARLTRTKARNELALQAGRDPVLEEALRHYRERFAHLIRQAVLRLQPHDRDPDPALVDEQAYVLMQFISGVMMSFASGDHTIRTAEQLDILMSGVVAGIDSAQQARRNGKARRTRDRSATSDTR